MAGVETRELDMENSALRDSGLVRKAIPPLTCARATHQGASGNRPLTLDYVYHTWLPRSGLTLSQPWIIERFSQDPQKARNEPLERSIYIPIVEA